MRQPYVLRILVTTGDPDGLRVVEKSNWSGRGMVFSRSDLTADLAGQLASPGVYVLIGSDPTQTFDRTIYVGEAEDVGKRLADHQRDDNKEFWTTTVVFRSKESELNKAHIRHLEAKLIEMAAGAHRVSIANSTRPQSPPMSLADRAEANGFLVEMLAIFPIIGLDCFDRAAPSATPRTEYRLRGPDAVEGRGEERSDGFLVFKGAMARISEVKSLPESSRNRRRRLIDGGLLIEVGSSYELTEDYLFDSPSGAADVLLGRSANGRAEWKDPQGVSLKDNQAKRTGTFS